MLTEGRVRNAALAEGHADGLAILQAQNSRYWFSAVTTGNHHVSCRQQVTQLAFSIDVPPVKFCSGIWDRGVPSVAFPCVSSVSRPNCTATCGGVRYMLTYMMGTAEQQRHRRAKAEVCFILLFVCPCAPAM